MIERLRFFLPSMIVLGIIALVTRIYIAILYKRMGEKLKSIEWLKDNEKKALLLVALPLQVLWAPSFEELVFRAPLIVIFPAISSKAWIGIWISSILFVFIHWFNKPLSLIELYRKKENGLTETDDFETEAKRYMESLGKKKTILRLAKIPVMLVLGIVTAYFGIKYQSIWLSVGIHVVWNQVMPLITQLLVIVFIVVILIIFKAKESLKKNN